MGALVVAHLPLHHASAIEIVAEGEVVHARLRAVEEEVGAARRRLHALRASPLSALATGGKTMRKRVGELRFRVNGATAVVVRIHDRFASVPAVIACRICSIQRELRV